MPLYANRHERWDQLCYRAYGSTSEAQVRALRSANRTVANNMTGFTFEGGERIEVPTLSSATVIETVEKPPWAR